jgi:hypothetical protein
MYKNILINESILLIEKKYSLWDYKYFGYPIYFTIRPYLLKDNKYLRKKVKLSIIIKTILNDLIILCKAYKYLHLYKNACFSSERGINFEKLFENKTERIIFFISDKNYNIENCENINNIYLTDSLINLIRLTIYIFNLFILPINIILNLSKVITFRKILYLNNSLSFFKTIIIFNKAFSDIYFCILLKRIFNKIVVSGGSCPNVITYFNRNDRCKVFEIQHGYIGKGHQLYAGILPQQVNLIQILPIFEDINNRVIHFLSDILLKDAYIYKFDIEGSFIYFGSPFDYYSGIKSKYLKKRFIYRSHPTLRYKYPNSNNIKKIRYALIEPSTLILVIKELKIPFSIICFKEDIDSIKSYFNLKDLALNYIDPHDICDDFLINNIL